MMEDKVQDLTNDLRKAMKIENIEWSETPENSFTRQTFESILADETQNTEEKINWISMMDDTEQDFTNDLRNMMKIETLEWSLDAEMPENSSCGQIYDLILAEKRQSFKMKLLTHNMLTSNIIKGVTKGFPLKIVPKKVEIKEVDYNPNFIVRTLTKVDWPALQQAATETGHGEDLPSALGENIEQDEELLKKIHNVLLQVEVIEGELVCPESGRIFPITNGIPNMLLLEHEVGH
ncbi:multifunctional methyltransferase subunit TRM112-like protein isoform X3 [Biomphalaria glabrata]|uniref:Multifunctional methyltransferase subunit TRM112-like protein n=1 Tax=Biomphalaria glabrata TaxID=6526 RepID=A0A9W3BEA6_BIOGL|nr:multifunctional methyltransferase subunit TRM112-like protein isoform X3 [Biomphalaria glabrata]